MSFLISSGSRSHLKNTSGMRVVDLFPSQSDQQVLLRATEMRKEAEILLTKDVIKPQAYTMAQNNNQSLESCALCLEEFTIVRKR